MGGFPQGFPAISIHGDRTQTEREQALKSFRAGKEKVLVATDVCARGIDIPNVAMVVNYDMPNQVFVCALLLLALCTLACARPRPRALSLVRLNACVGAEDMWAQCTLMHPCLPDTAAQRKESQ